MLGHLHRRSNPTLMLRLNAARWFVRAVSERLRTIHKVTGSIIRFQRTFFEKGPEDLRPLSLTRRIYGLNRLRGLGLVDPSGTGGAQVTSFTCLSRFVVRH